MPNRSPLVTVLLTVLTAIAAFGTYFVVDSYDLLRSEMERNRRDMQVIQSDLTRLRRVMATRPALAAPGGELPGSELPGAGGELRGASAATPFNDSDLIDPEAQDGGIRRMRMQSFPSGWNYATTNEGIVRSIWDLCNDSLAARNSRDPKRYEPRLAESWTESADGRVFTIRLREGILWHDFTDPITKTAHHDVPVKAADFVFALETIRNPHIPQAAPLANYYNDLESIAAPDDRTLVVTWKETYFLAKDFTLGMQPLPRHLYRPDSKTSDEDFAEDMIARKTARDQLVVGCGPYRFAEYVKGSRLVLRRNDRYVGPPPSIPTLVYQVLADENKALMDFDSDRLDEMGLTSIMWERQTPAPRYLTVCDNVDKAEALTERHNDAKRAAYLAGAPFGEHAMEKYMYRSFSFSFIAWNMRRPLFADRQTRKALTHAIDRQRIIREVFYGHGVETTGYFVPHSLYYDHDIQAWPFSLDEAARILADAGWADTDGDGILDRDIDGDGTRDAFRFTFLMFTPHPYQSKWVPMIQQDMQKIGIAMSVKSVEASVYFKMVDDRNFDACGFYWGGGIESDPFQLWHGSEADKPASSNIPGFKHAEADTIIETARRTLDIDRRIELYKRFHRILHEEQPYTFIHCPNALFALNKRFVNVRVLPTGMPRIHTWIPTAMQVHE